MQIWSINYCILKMSRYTNIVYIGRYLGLTYIERFISTYCCFFRYICWSVNSMSWVIKFKNFFSHVRKLRQDLYLRPLWKAHFGLPGTFFLLFYLVCKLCKGLFQSVCQSVNCMSWVFESWNIPRRCHVT